MRVQFHIAKLEKERRTSRIIIYIFSVCFSVFICWQKFCILLYFFLCNFIACRDAGMLIWVNSKIQARRYSYICICDTSWFWCEHPFTSWLRMWSLKFFNFYWNWFRWHSHEMILLFVEKMGRRRHWMIHVIIQ